MTFVPKGIIPPIITPLTDEGEVNYPVLRQMVNHLIDNGVHGLFHLEQPENSTHSMMIHTERSLRQSLMRQQDVFQFMVEQAILQQEELSDW